MAASITHLRFALHKSIFRAAGRNLSCSPILLAHYRREEETAKSQAAKSILSLPKVSAALAAASGSFGVAFAESSSSSILPASLVWGLKVAPPACFFFLQVSGLKTVKAIQREKSTGQLSVLPFLSLATNCIVWSLYGGLVSDLTVLVPNLSGAALGIYYTSVFNKYSPSSLVPQFLVSGGIIGATSSMALLLPPDQAAQNIGYTGCALAVILMASPLATMATVLRDKSTASMPFVTSVATFLNASAWASYGIFVAHDPIIWGPNVLGLAAACVQLSLFARFGFANDKE